MTPNVYEFFRFKTFTYSYVVVDPDSQQCAVIDSVLDYDPASGRTSYETADKLIEFVVESGLQVEWILKPMFMLIILSAAPYIKQKSVANSVLVTKSQWYRIRLAKLFNAGSDFAMDGSQFDHLFADQERFHPWRY